MAKNSTKAKDETTPAGEGEQNAAGASPRPTEEELGGASVAAPSSTADAVPLPPEGKAFSGTHTVNTARGLNLRKAPSYGASVVEILPFGTPVQARHPKDDPAGWLCVMTERGKHGFVAERYVSPIKE